MEIALLSGVAVVDMEDAVVVLLDLLLLLIFDGWFPSKKKKKLMVVVWGLKSKIPIPNPAKYCRFRYFLFNGNR